MANEPLSRPLSEAALADDSYEAFLEEMKGLAAPLRALQLQAAQSCAPTVRHIIHTRSQDFQLIEHTLDRLLDCACIPEGLALFKTLCRYYFILNPSAAVDYVNAYREMWDQEPDQPKEVEA